MGQIGRAVVAAPLRAVVWPVAAQSIPAFPGAEGAGAEALGTMNFDFRNNVNYDWGNEDGENARVIKMNDVDNYSVAVSGAKLTLARTAHCGHRAPATESRRPCPLASATPQQADGGDPLAGRPS